MNRSLLVLGITLAAALPARADFTHKIQSSVSWMLMELQPRAVRVGSSYSISGWRQSRDLMVALLALIGGLDDLTRRSAVDYTGTVPTQTGTGKRIHSANLHGR